MIANVDMRSCHPDIARRQLTAYTVLRFVIAMSIGGLIALLEHCSWLPCYLTEWIVIFPQESSFWLSLTGPLLLQTLPAPLLSVAGLHRMGYPYASRIVCGLFWVSHGVDAWNFLLALSQNGWDTWFALVFMIAVFIAMIDVMLRVHLTATAGVACDISAPAVGLSPVAYWERCIRLWGALLILQMAFDLLYLSIL